MIDKITIDCKIFLNSWFYSVFSMSIQSNCHGIVSSEDTSNILGEENLPFEVGSTPDGWSMEMKTPHHLSYRKDA